MTVSPSWVTTLKFELRALPASGCRVATQEGPRRMKSMIVIATAVALMVAGCQGGSRPARTTSQAPAAQPASRQLSAAELRQLYAAGVTSYSSGSSGPRTFAGYHSPDGKIILHSPQMNDIGTYRITDDGESEPETQLSGMGSRPSNDVAGRPEHDRGPPAEWGSDPGNQCAGQSRGILSSEPVSER